MGFKDRKKKREVAAAVERGRYLLVTERGQDAFEFVEHAVKRFPENAELRLILASMFLKFQPERVASQAALAAELSADDPGIQVRAGHLMFDRGEVEGARACARRASERAGPDFIHVSGLETLEGLIAALDGEGALAEGKFRSALKQDPEFSSCAFHLAKFLASRDRQDEALAVIDESLRQAKDKGDLERLRGQIVRSAGLDP